MPLGLREKQLFYQDLGALIRSGRPFPAAVDTLEAETRGPARRLLRSIQRNLRDGATVSEAFAARPDVITQLEQAIVGACEKSGRLDRGCAYLATHFETLHRCRETIIRKSAYPVFILFFGTFLMAVPRLFTDGTGAYLRHTVGFLWVVCLGAFLIFLLVQLLRRLARVTTAVDALLINLPPFGKVRRSFVLARFCATYEMHLDAGINVIDSLLAAAEVSQSALIRRAAHAAVPALRRGEQLVPQLSRHGVFPQTMLRSLRIGEETGGIDRELQTLTADFERQGQRRLEALAEWLTRLLYILILCYLGYQIISVYKGVLDSYDAILK